LLSQICHKGEFSGRAVRQLEISLQCEYGNPGKRTVTFKEALSEKRQIWEVLRPQLIGMEIPGPIVLINMRFTEIAWAQGWQVHLFSRQEGRRIQLEEGLRKLRARYGHSPVAHVVEMEPWSRIPERRKALADFSRARFGAPPEWLVAGG